MREIEDVDKQTCAALLNMLGFDSYNMHFAEYANSTINSHKTTFLLKSVHRNKVGSVVNITLNQTYFKTYDDMITFARQLHTKKHG